MISVSTLLRRLEQGDCGEVVHARCWVLRDRNRSSDRDWVFWTFCCFWPWAGDGLRYRPYFENYTVDASILQLIIDQLHKMILKIISQFQTQSSDWVEF